jgi:hypothetical protein
LRFLPVASWLYLVSAYWIFIAGVFGVGILVGWWAEGMRGGGAVSAWLEQGRDEP